MLVLYRKLFHKWSWKAKVSRVVKFNTCSGFSKLKLPNNTIALDTTTPCLSHLDVLCAQLYKQLYEFIKI